jgi:16S rRNA (guanine527-N7)-methyltransferase
VDLVAHDPQAPTAIRSRAAIIDDHVADSLVALELDAVQSATGAVDLGSGAGFPGLALAIALPQTEFTLVESSGRKCAFLRRAVEECGISNADVVHSRAESFVKGLARFDLATARAVASLNVTAEYAAPLLRVGGSLTAWRGRRDADAEATACRAALELGLEEPEIHRVEPYQSAAHRHLYVMRKATATPPGFPRRPGAALKHPLGGRARRGRRGDAGQWAPKSGGRPGPGCSGQGAPEAAWDESSDRARR